MKNKGTTSYKIGDQNAVQYLTLTTVEWVDLFTRRKNKGIIVESLGFCRGNKGLELFAYCLMTNHIHMVCRAKEGFLLSDILRDLKRHTAKHLLQSVMQGEESRRDWLLPILKETGTNNPKNKEYQVWRQDNHPIELSTNPVIDQKVKYIYNNPVEAGIVQYPEDYLYSSARNYAGLDAVMEIDIM